MSIMIEKNRQHLWMITAGVVFIVVASLVVYIPAMRSGYIWDDDVYVEANPLLSSPDGLWNIWMGKHIPSQYVPMVYTTFRFEYLLWGLRPFGYHLTNVLLHASNALLIWLLLSRLKVRGAWFASAIFALHPVHVESVAWITERKNVLSLFFCLVSAVAYFQYAFGSGEESTKSRSETYYQLSTFLFLCALASKAVMCFFPVLLLIVLWWKRGRIILKDIRDLLRFFVLGLGWGLFIMWWEHKYQETGTVEFGFTPIKRILLASHALWFYLGKLLYPVNLAFSYPKWNIEPTNPLNYTWLFLCLAASWGMWHWREKLQRGSIAAVVFFVVALSPMLGFVSLYTFVYTYVADHYQYVASIGPITLFVTIGCIAVSRLGKYAKDISIISVVLILSTLGTLTWRQCHIYKDRETLWQDTIRKNPDSSMAHLNLGLEYAIRNRLDEAIGQFNKVLQLNPDCAEAYNNLGIVFGNEGNLDEAERYFLLALKKKPNFAYAHYNLGSLLDRKGKRDEAIQEYMKVLEINPNFGQAEAALAAARSKKAFGGVGTEAK